MGQYEILNYLRELSLRGYRGFVTSYEISKKTKCDKGNTSRWVHKLLEMGVLERNLKYGFGLAVRVKEEHIASEFLCKEQCSTIETFAVSRGVN